MDLVGSEIQLMDEILHHGMGRQTGPLFDPQRGATRAWRPFGGLRVAHFGFKQGPRFRPIPGCAGFRPPAVRTYTDDSLEGFKSVMWVVAVVGWVSG